MAIQINNGPYFHEQLKVHILHCLHDLVERAVHIQISLEYFCVALEKATSSHVCLV